MASKDQTMMTLFTEESMKKNKTGKKYRMNCKVSGDMIEYDRGDTGWKHMIRLNELDEVELHEKITINKHKYENIICLKANKDVKFLKAENRNEMNEWYRLLMKILTKFKWIDAEPECTIEGKKRRATNPEGMKRRQRQTQTQSAYGSLQGGFNANENHQTEESSTDSSSDDSPIHSITNGIDHPLYEESIVTERQQQAIVTEPAYMNVKQSSKSTIPPKPPVRKESIKPKVPVESDETQYMDLLPRNTPPKVPTSAEAANRITQNQTSKNDIKTNLERLFKDRLTSTENVYVAQHPKPSKPEGTSTCCPPAKESKEDFIYENREVNRRKSSLHNINSKPKPPVQRKPSLPCKPVGHTVGQGGGGGPCKPVVQGGGDREVTQPQLPKRDGQALVTSIEKFRQFQDKESILIPLNKKAVAGGRRLALVKVPGLGYLWICRWDLKGNPLEEILHPGDQILTINDIDLETSDATFAYDLMDKLVQNVEIKLNIRRAPYAQVLHLKRTADNRDIGIQLNGNVIKHVDSNGLFRQASRGKTRSVLGRPGELVEWAITEINMQPVNFNATSEQVNNLLEKSDPDVALVIQPADLIQAMKTALSQCPLCGRGCCCHN